MNIIADMRRRILTDLKGGIERVYELGVSDRLRKFIAENVPEVEIVKKDGLKEVIRMKTKANHHFDS